MSDILDTQTENASVNEVPVDDNSAVVDSTVENNNETANHDVSDSESNWYDSLNDELKQSEGFDKFASKFKDVDSLAKSYMNLEKMVGNKAKSGIPTEDSTEEEINEFYTQLGRPESHGDYKWDNPLEGFEFDTERLTERNAALHKVGITNDQYNTIMDIYAEEVSLMQDDWQMNEQSIIQDTISSLQGQWGDKYDQNIAAANKIAEKFGVKDALKQSGVINHKPVIEMLYKVHEATTEDGIVKSVDSGYSKTEEINVIKSQMEKLNRGSEEYQKLWSKYIKLIG